MKLGLGLAIAFVFVAGCSSSSEPSSSGAPAGGQASATTASALSCRQKAGADTDDECAAVSGKPRKLDCDIASQTEEALAAGCVREKAGSNDVCCPTSVSGKEEVSVSGCTEPSDTLTDSDCAGTPEARKLSCTTSAQQKRGIELGCRAEDQGQKTDFDLCCPTWVRGR